MKTATFKTLCEKCQHIFDIPLLSDFSYGKFIAKDKSGKVFAHLQAIDNEGWNRISEIFDNLSENKTNYTTEHFQWIVGECLDSVNGDKISIANRYVCPKCHSSVKYGPGEKTGEMNLPEASFSEFLSLSDEEQTAKIKTLLDLLHKC